METEDTNKTHDKTLTISGNFDSFDQIFNIFIPFQDIDLGGLDSDKCDDLDTECLTYLNDVFCPAHPTSFLCSRDPIIKEIIINNVSDAEFNATLKNFQLLDLFRDIGKLRDLFETLTNIQQEDDIEDTEFKSYIDERFQSLTSGLDEEREKNTNLQLVLWLIIVAFLSVTVIGIAGFIYWKKRIEGGRASQQYY